MCFIIINASVCFRNYAPRNFIYASTKVLLDLKSIVCITYLCRVFCAYQITKRLLHIHTCALCLLKLMLYQCQQFLCIYCTQAHQGFYDILSHRVCFKCHALGYFRYVSIGVVLDMESTIMLILLIHIGACYVCDKTLVHIAFHHVFNV